MTQFKGQYRIESARLPGWDYRNAGWYFITICTRDGYAFFGDVVNSEMQFSALGEVALPILAGDPGSHSRGADG